MRVILVGQPAARARLRAELPASIEVVGEHVTAADAKVLAGQAVEAPVHVSCASQMPEAPRQTMPALPALCVQAAELPVQTSSVHGRPSNAPEFMSFPSSVTVGSRSPPSAATTCRIGSLNCVANSKSRLSCAGTAMMAPVPYSMST